MYMRKENSLTSVILIDVTIEDKKGNELDWINLITPVILNISNASFQEYSSNSLQGSRTQLAPPSSDPLPLWELGR